MKTRFFALATLVLALAACNNDNENLNGDPVAAQFTANIAPATRASGTTWTGGDRIGITDIGNDTQVTFNLIASITFAYNLLL